MNRIVADPDECVWFYADGWRYGQIVKEYSANRVTVMDCSGTRSVCAKMDSGKWVATKSREFKDQIHLKRENNDGKDKKPEPKKRFKIKIKKR